MPFRHPLDVTFSMVDAAGILFFSRAFELAHAAYEAALAAGGLPLARILAEADWVLPLVHAEADYLRPMRLGERVTVEVEVEGVRERSFTVGFTVRGPAGEADLRARLRCVHACIDKAAFTPRPLPAEVLDALRASGGLGAGG